jgi:hypothetical protein
VAAELGGVYGMLCHAFYFYAVRDDDSSTEDAGCLLSFDAFKTLCRESGVLDVSHFLDPAGKDAAAAASGAFARVRSRKLTPAQEAALEKARAEAVQRAEGRLDVSLSQLFRASEFEFDREEGLSFNELLSLRMDDRRKLTNVDAYE